MPASPTTYKLLPPKDEILVAIALQKKHVEDITSYMWYIIPVAERFGERVYSIAAMALKECGHEVTADELKLLALELQTPEGVEKYAVNRRIHIGTNLTSYKNV